MFIRSENLCKIKDLLKSIIDLKGKFRSNCNCQHRIKQVTFAVWILPN